MTPHPPAPLRPVSDEHRHEPADYELEPNELEVCPNPWCESHKRPERGYVPFISKNRASSELRVACPVCPMSGPWADTEAEARKAWNQRSSLATRPDTKPTGDMREALEAAYIAGATDVHEWWAAGNTEREADFGEAASDYARSIALTALTQAPRSCCADEREPFQNRVDAWMDACFGDAIKADMLERADRFCEEALELCQTVPQFSAERAHALVDYVFGRPVGVRFQEVGGVRVTLSALCNADDINEDGAAETELARIWTKVEQIRAKQAAKPVGSALPVATAIRSNSHAKD